MHGARKGTSWFARRDCSSQSSPSALSQPWPQRAPGSRSRLHRRRSNADIHHIRCARPPPWAGARPSSSSANRNASRCSLPAWLQQRRSARPGSWKTRQRRRLAMKRWISRQARAVGGRASDGRAARNRTIRLSRIMAGQALRRRRTPRRRDRWRGTRPFRSSSPGCAAIPACRRASAAGASRASGSPD